MRKGLTFLSFCLIGLAVPRADAVIIYNTGSNTVSIPGLTGFATTGAMMDGLAVTAVFDGFAPQTLFWADTGLNSGGVAGLVAGTNRTWSLSLDGDTFSADWEFDQVGMGPPLTLLSLFLDGRNALTVFDRTLDPPSEGTVGSAFGADWFCNTGACNNLDVTYDYQVGIGASAPVGDLWHTVFIDWTTQPPGSTQGQFTFRQDTDNDSRLTDEPIPEPGTLVLLGAGLAAMRLRRRRRQA